MKRLLCAALLVTLALGSWRAAEALAGPGIANTAAGANPVATIRAFTNRPDLEVAELPGQPTPRGVAARVFVTPDRSARFTVDATDGQVLVADLPTGLVPLNAAANPAIVRPDRGQARQLAQGFLASKVGGFERLALLSEETEEHGAAGQQYRFTWGEQVGTQQAVTLRRVAVSVDGGTGALVGFMQVLPTALAVSVEPTITRAQALAIARGHFGTTVTASSATLDVWWKDNDRAQAQILRWKVTLESTEAVPGIPQRAAYTIDAHSGAILEELR